MRFSGTVAILFAIVLQIPEKATAQNECWDNQESTSSVSLRGICAVSETVCWASGSENTVLLTTDGGNTWQSVGPKDPENSTETAKADFRDVHAWDENTAVIMAAGDPDKIYRTENGGETWRCVFEHPNANAFLDGIAFDEQGVNGWVMGDPIDGHMTLVQTTDSGKTWTLQPESEVPELRENVAGFAASGTNLAVLFDGKIIIGLGGAGGIRGKAEVSLSPDGRSWSTISTPMSGGEAAGIFSIAGYDKKLIAVGGDYTVADGTTDNCMISRDLGATWTLVTESNPSGYRSVVAFATTDKGVIAVAAGPNGTDSSNDFGKTWDRVSDTGFHTLSFVPGTNYGWAAGSEGRIARWKR